jgi:hypothetical protein
VAAIAPVVGGENVCPKWNSTKPRRVSPDKHATGLGQTEWQGTGGIEGLRWFETDSRGPGGFVRLPDDMALTVEMASGGRSSVRVGRVRAWERFLSGRVAAAD